MNGARSHSLLPLVFISIDLLFLVVFSFYPSAVLLKSTESILFIFGRFFIYFGKCLPVCVKYSLEITVYWSLKGIITPLSLSEFKMVSKRQ